MVTNPLLGCNQADIDLYFANAKCHSRQGFCTAHVETIASIGSLRIKLECPNFTESLAARSVEKNNLTVVKP